MVDWCAGDHKTCMWWPGDISDLQSWVIVVTCAQSALSDERSLLEALLEKWGGFRCVVENEAGLGGTELP